MPKTILSFGELLWDLLPTGPVLGGAACNFAYRASAFGHSVLFCSRVGSDDLGIRAKQTLRDLGLDTSLIQTDITAPTGTVNVTLDAGNNPDYFIVPNVAYDRIEASAEALAVASRADCVCFGTLSQRSEVSCRALAALLDRAPAAVKVLDVNLRKDCFCAEVVGASLARAHVLKLNEHEVPVVANIAGLPSDIRGFAEAVVQRHDLRVCVVTLGEKGAFAVSRAGERAYAPGFAVEVADTLGSGDAFTGAFVHAHLSGTSLHEACELGCALGAIVATQNGGTQPATPTEVARLRQSRKDRIFLSGGLLP